MQIDVIKLHASADTFVSQLNVTFDSVKKQIEEEDLSPEYL